MLRGIVGIGTLMLVQVVFTFLRRNSRVARILQNEPLLLMVRTRVLHDNLRAARVTEGELRARLRAAGVHDTDSIFAVVLKTTGDVSVILGDGHSASEILDDVRDADLLDPTTTST